MDDGVYDSCMCSEVLSRYALALIRELTEENERLMERLSREAKCQYDLATQIVDLKAEVAQVKVDTVRKMQERLMEASFVLLDADGKATSLVEVADIAQIAKELLEEV